VTLLFSGYLCLLVWIVLWKLHAPYVGLDAMRQIKLTPFVAGGGFGASAPAEVLANLLLFVPFGVYLGTLRPSWAWWQAAGMIGAASLALETSQYVLALGSTDITDLIVNTAGGIAGLGLLALARRTLRARTATATIWVCSTATVLVVLMIGTFIGSPRLLPPHHDANPTSTVRVR
jgi:glycopeptide antibiotics resistance protein